MKTLYFVTPVSLGWHTAEIADTIKHALRDLNLSESIRIFQTVDHSTIAHSKRMAIVIVHFSDEEWEDEERRDEKILDIKEAISKSKYTSMDDTNYPEVFFDFTRN
jgi:hypothetical protein